MFQDEARSCSTLRTNTDPFQRKDFLKRFKNVKWYVQTVIGFAHIKDFGPVPDGKGDTLIRWKKKVQLLPARL